MSVTPRQEIDRKRQLSRDVMNELQQRLGKQTGDALPERIHSTAKPQSGQKLDQEVEIVGEADTSILQTLKDAMSSLRDRFVVFRSHVQDDR